MRSQDSNQGRPGGGGRLDLILCYLEQFFIESFEYNIFILSIIGFNRLGNFLVHISAGVLQIFENFKILKVAVKL